MTGERWMAGATHSPQPGGVPLDATLPSRATWHITADRLNAAGAQPPFGNVSTYLKNAGYCPHLMVDPFTGAIEQFYPADVGARALSRWNQDGARHIQVEIYFSPGMIRDGIRYETVQDTPCAGLEEIAAWMDGHGIPRTWPMGEPTWTPARDWSVWNSQGGYYGHSQVPGEDHIDPGPMPALTGGAAAAGRRLLIQDVPELYYP